MVAMVYHLPLEPLPEEEIIVIIRDSVSSYRSARTEPVSIDYVVED